MKFAIDLGHGCKPHDTGAVGLVNEEVEVRLISKLLIDALKKAGHNVLVIDPKTCSSVNDSLSKRVQASNNFGADLYVSLHLNAFEKTTKAMGTEVYAISAQGDKYAGSVLKSLVSLGFKDRGIKDTKYFVLKYATAPAILIEGYFIDSEADVNLAKSLGADTIGLAIADGILKAIGESLPKIPPKTPNSPPAPPSTTVKPTGKIANKYKLKFALDAQVSNQLVIGLLTLYHNGASVNSYRGTSSKAGTQNLGSWNYTGGLLPPTAEVIEHTGKPMTVKTKPLYLDIKGVNGEFYQINPFSMQTDANLRGDWGIHRDIDPRPGTMGCVGLKTEEGMKAFIRDMKAVYESGEHEIELEVVYY